VRIDSLDHVVLTVADVEATCAFYVRALGMEVVTFPGRHARRSFRLFRSTFATPMAT
jgi:catechol 2,3-dioxygenase-like lactoylglutathione lyase family enzyme